MAKPGVSLSRMYAINKQVLEMYVQFGKADMRGGRYDSALTNLTAAITMKPQFVEAYFQRGLCHMLLKQFEAAVSDFQQVLTLDPKYDERVFILQGLCCKQAGDIVGAIRHLGKGIQRNLHFVDALVARGQLYLKTEAWEKALRDFDAALRADPKTVVAYCGEADAYIGLNDPHSAQRVLLQAIKTKPDYEEAFVHRARLLHQQSDGDKDLAIRCLDDAVRISSGKNADGQCTNVPALLLRGRIAYETKRYDEAQADLQRAVELAPENYEVYMYRGLVFFQRDEYEASFVDLDRCLRLPHTKEHAADIALYRGLCKVILQLQVGQADIALKQLDQLGTHHTEPLLFLYRAHSFFLTETFELAVHDYQRYIRGKAEAKDDMTAHRNLGIARALRDYVRRDFTSSLESLDIAGSRCSYVCRALTLLRLGNERCLEAIEAATCALKCEQDCVETDAFVYYIRALSYQIAQQYDRAILDLTKAINLDELNLDYYVERGLARVLSDDLKGAIADFTAAHTLDEHAPQPLVMRARCYASKGFKTKALVDIEACKCAAAYCVQGDMMFHAGQLADALSSYAHALKLSGNFIRAFRMRANVFLRMGKFPEARIELNHIVKLRASDRSVLYDRDVLKALGLAAEGDYHKAAQFFTKLLNQQPQPADTAFSVAHLLSYRGLCHWCVDERAAALADYERGQDEDGTVAALWLNCAVVHLADRNYDAAVSCIDRLTEVAEGPRAHLLRALVMTALGDSLQSEADIVHVLRAEPALVDRFMRETDRPLMIDVIADGKPTAAIGRHVASIRAGHRLIQVRPVFAFPVVHSPHLRPTLSDSAAFNMNPTAIHHLPVAPWKHLPTVHREVPMTPSVMLSDTPAPPVTPAQTPLPPDILFSPTPDVSVASTLPTSPDQSPIAASTP